MRNPADDTSECDLHDLTVEQAMAKFLSQYSHAVAESRQPRPIAVIHGYNRGNAISFALREFLAEHQAEVDFVPGELLDGNPGHTKVYPKLPLPEWRESLGLQIAAFCAKPKPRERIAGEFARWGEPRVKATLEQLVREGSLQPTTKNGRRCYVAGAATTD